MKLLVEIDNFVTENIYQKIVDISQKQPSWWVIQSAIAVLLFQIIRMYFSGFGITSVFAFLFWTTYTFFAITLTEYFMKSVPIIDNTCKILSVILILMRFLMELSTINVLGIISDFLFLSHIYFSSCKPPAPPKKKFSIQPSLQN